MNRVRQRFASSKGFTLLEVLIVVVILGVLAAIVLPAVAGQTTESRKQAKKADLKEVEKSVDRFDSEFDSFPITESTDPTKQVKDKSPKDDIIVIRIDSFGSSTQADNDPTLDSLTDPLDVTCTGTTVADAVDECFGSIDFDGLVPDFITAEPEHDREDIEPTTTTGTAVGDTSLDVDFSIPNCNRGKDRCDFVLDDGDNLETEGLLGVWSVDRKRRAFAFKEDFQYGR